MTSVEAVPRVTFGIIVLNGEPFTRYCLRSLYPFAHEIIVVEGGHDSARAVATADGHSTDGTLEALRRFKAEEDPLDKVTIVTRDGFWPKVDAYGRNRTAQSQAYAELATGDYLWQVDIDEFYRPEDMRSVFRMLSQEPDVAGASFYLRVFWGRPDYEVDGWKWRKRDVHRLFKWGPGYTYVTHEPPTVKDADQRNLRTRRWVGGEEMARRGIFLYHYSQLFPRQMREKALIYQDEKPETCAALAEWVESSYIRLDHPFRVERHHWEPSWLRRCRSSHPPAVLQMMSDIESGVVREELRAVDDVERLLSTWQYRLACLGLAGLRPVDRAWAWSRHQALRAGHLARMAGGASAGRRRQGGPRASESNDRRAHR